MDLVKLKSFEDKLPFLTYKGQLCTPARTLGAVLGYDESGHALVKLISDEWANEFKLGHHHEVIKGQTLKDFKSLSEVGGFCPPSAPKLMLLMEPGINRVLLLTKKDIGIKVRDFLDTEVMPQLVKSGTYAPTPVLPPLSKTAIKDFSSLLLRLERIPGVFRKHLGGFTATDQETVRSKIRWVLMQIPDGPPSDLSKLLTSSANLSDEALAQLPWFPPIGRTWKEDFQVVYPYYRTTEQFQARKRLLFKQQPNCQDCEIVQSAEPHHLNYKNLVKHGMEFAGDMVALCAPCHRKRHADKAQGELFEQPKKPAQPAPQPAAPQF